MKRVTLVLLRLYRLVLSPVLHQALGVRHACRYSPTCSEFATIHIAKDGVLVGGIKSLIRLLYCQPFVKTLPKALQQ